MKILRNYLKSLVYILLVMSLLLVGVEALARTAWVDSHLMLPTYGFNDDNYDIQLDLLAKYQAKYGQIDCIYLGSSQVFRAINPEIVAEVYEAETGEALYCFNMGHFGMWTYGAERLARYIIATYHPRYLIYGMSPVALNAESDFDNALTTSDWVAYIHEDTGRKGWLIENSRAYRYYLRYQNWLDPESDALMESLQLSASRYTATGHIPINSTREDVSLPPEPVYTPGYPHSRQLTALQYFLDPLQHGSTQVIFIGMPLHNSFPAAYPDRMERYTEILETQILPSEVLFWDAHYNLNLPDEFWVDRTHLNKAGSIQFSYWLGMQLAQWQLAGKPADFKAVEVELPFTQNQNISSIN